MNRSRILGESEHFNVEVDQIMYPFAVIRLSQFAGVHCHLTLANSSNQPIRNEYLPKSCYNSLLHDTLNSITCNIVVEVLLFKVIRFYLQINHYSFIISNQITQSYLLEYLMYLLYLFQMPLLLFDIKRHYQHSLIVSKTLCS